MLGREKFIVVEGPIGVGKSSLARRLAKSFQVSLLMERPAENPFLKQFYGDSSQFALATQLFFLMQRVEQLQAQSSSQTQFAGHVADFMLEKDPLFAEVTLGSEKLRLYRQIYQNLSIVPPKPDLVIYLQAPVRVLSERINKRGIGYELGMDAAYLEKLSDAYMTFFHRYNTSPLLIVNATEINPVDNDAHYDALLQHINQIDGGKHFFNPLA